MTFIKALLQSARSRRRTGSEAVGAPSERLGLKGQERFANTRPAGQSGRRGGELGESLILFFKRTKRSSRKRLKRQEKGRPVDQAPTEAGRAGLRPEHRREKNEREFFQALTCTPSPNLPIISAGTLGTHEGRTPGFWLPTSAPLSDLVLDSDGKHLPTGLA